MADVVLVQREWAFPHCPGELGQLTKMPALQAADSRGRMACQVLQRIDYTSHDIAPTSWREPRNENYREDSRLKKSTCSHI